MHLQKRTRRSKGKTYQYWELTEGDWESIHEGVEAKLCKGEHGNETFILCRSAKRREKERAIHERFEERRKERLEKIARSCLSEGCYILRSNVNEWSAEDLWNAYIQLTEAEAAFRIHKSDLGLRPIWHQKKERVQAHILVCFLAYVLRKAFAGMCKAAGLGDEPRKVFDEIAQIQLVDVVLPTKTGVEIRRRCVAKPTKHQAILLQHLDLRLPQTLRIAEM